MRSHGFTFVELLLASLMMAILFVGLGGHLRGGITVWQRATRTAQALQQRRVGLDRLEQDLANAFRYHDEEDPRQDAPLPLPHFASDQMSWVTVITHQDPPMVHRVTYRCDEQGLWRFSQPISAARAEQEPVAELLIPDCETLALQYAYLPPETTSPPTQPSETLDWRAQWDEPGQLPRLIAISLTLVKSREDEPEAAGPFGTMVSRRFMIPVGTLKVWEPPSSS